MGTKTKNLQRTFAEMYNSEKYALLKQKIRFSASFSNSRTIVLFMEENYNKPSDFFAIEVQNSSFLAK